MKSVYSPSGHIIYNAAFYADYQRAGTWPADGIEVSDEDAVTFNGRNEPVGKMLDYHEGALCWVERPSPELTKEQLISQSEQKKSALLSMAKDKIVIWQTKLLMGRQMTTEETVALNVWMDYIDAVVAVDTSTAPGITWPEQPAA